MAVTAENGYTDECRISDAVEKRYGEVSTRPSVVLVMKMNHTYLRANISIRILTLTVNM